MIQQLVRAEFLGFMEDESKILSLVSDMAETFDKVAVNKYHTPHLYGVFLRALLASKLDHSQPSSPRLAAASKLSTQGPVITANDPAMMMNGSAYSTGMESPSRSTFGNTNDMFGLEMYKSLGENYGDMSNFVNPFDMPTQAATTTADSMQHFSAETTLGADPNVPMSLDSFLSAGFWDSMLVPGELITIRLKLILMLV